MDSAYDQLNPWGPDYDYWLALVSRLAPSSIVDLGCGTGQLTVLFARARETAHVVGVDPDPQMLAVARARSGHQMVDWLDGYASEIPTASADLITMTSHVAQVFLTDEDWAQALRDMRRALTQRGRIAFDMRNARARGWEAWNRADTLQQIKTDQGAAPRGAESARMRRRS